MGVSQEKEDSRLILLYKYLKGAASIPTDDLIPQLGAAEIISLTFQTPAARTDIYKGPFFPQTIRDWNALPDTITITKTCLYNFDHP